MIGDAEQYERLMRLYREFGDEELLALSRDMNDLTDTAQDVLRAEISARRLVSSSPREAELIEGEGLDAFPPERFAGLSSTDCVWEFAESEDALAAGAMLGAADIHYEVILPSSEKLDLGAPRVAVLAEDAAKAQQILCRPIPEEFRILVRTRDQFVVPTCPRCGAPDPLLESIEPTNEWRCENCGKVWQDRAGLN